MLYIRTVCCFERGCKFVGINFHSTTKLVKIHDWIVWKYSFLVYFQGDTVLTLICIFIGMKSDSVPLFSFFQKIRYVLTKQKAELYLVRLLFLSVVLEELSSEDLCLQNPMCLCNQIILRLKYQVCDTLSTLLHSYTNLYFCSSRCAVNFLFSCNAGKI